MNSTLLIAVTLGLRHGTDPDHLAAIDGLSRLRPNPLNGLLFALGHGLFVTTLAVGIGQMVSERLAFLGPWLLIAVGVVNAWRLWQPASSQRLPHRLPILQPLLLGVLMAAGFETASQFAALVLTNRLSPWLVGGAFTLGMALVDGVDGLLAASTQLLARTGRQAARKASRSLGIVAVISSFALGGCELLGIDLDPYALPLGLSLFGIVVVIRLAARATETRSSLSDAISALLPLHLPTSQRWLSRDMSPERLDVLRWTEVDWRIEDA